MEFSAPEASARSGGADRLFLVPHQPPPPPGFVAAGHSFPAWIAAMPSEIRVRSRTASTSVLDREVQRIKPMRLAMSEGTRRLLHQWAVPPATASLEGYVHCLACLQPGFIYDGLHDLSSFPKA